MPSEKNRAFLKKQVFEEFQAIIDTSSNEVIPLLALHFIGESFANIDHLEIMEKMQNDFADMDLSSPYYEDFVEEMRFLEFKNGEISSSDMSWIKWLGLALLVPFAAFLWWKINSDQEGNKSKSGQTFQTLSKQEKKVYNLLKSGKSNKEISSELHIEVSTVKSHLHKIYSRLGVKSRKEIVDE